MENHKSFDDYLEDGTLESKMKYSNESARKANKEVDREARDQEKYASRIALLKQGYSQTEVAEPEGLRRAAIYEFLDARPKLRKIWENAREEKKYGLIKLLLMQGYSQKAVARIGDTYPKNLRLYLRRRPEIRKAWEAARNK
jgi:hypothetical protein